MARRPLSKKSLRILQSVHFDFGIISEPTKSRSANFYHWRCYLRSDVSEKVNILATIERTGEISTFIVNKSDPDKRWPITEFLRQQEKQ